MPDQGRAPRVFLCHASEDKDIVRPLALRLHEAGIDTFFDEWEIAVGDSIRRKIDQGLGDCTHFLIALSPRSIGKPWVEEELDAAFDRLTAGRIPILPVLFDPPGTALPPLLRGKKWLALDRGLGNVQELFDAVLGASRKPPVIAAFATAAGDPRAHSSSRQPFPANAATSGQESGPAIREGSQGNDGASSMTVLIVTALALEMTAVCEQLPGHQEHNLSNGTVCRRGTFNGDHAQWDVVVLTTGRPGPEAAATITTSAIAELKPSIALFVGVAGGLKDVSIGAVVAANRVYAFEYGKDEKEFKPRPDLYVSSFALEQRALSVSQFGGWQSRIKGTSKRRTPPESRVAPIATGSKVVADSESPSMILLKRNYSDAVAVEMEGYGFLSALHLYSNVKALVVRGISDLIDGKAKADKGGSQERAARHAAAFAFTVLAEHDPDPGAKKPGTNGHSRKDLEQRLAKLKEEMVGALGNSQAAVRALATALGVQMEGDKWPRSAVAQAQLLIDNLMNAKLLHAIDSLGEAHDLALSDRAHNPIIEVSRRLIPWLYVSSGDVDLKVLESQRLGRLIPLPVGLTTFTEIVMAGFELRAADYQWLTAEADKTGHLTPTYLVPIPPESGMTKEVLGNVRLDLRRRLEADPTVARKPDNIQDDIINNLLKAMLTKQGKRLYWVCDLPNDGNDAADARQTMSAIAKTYDHLVVAEVDNRLAVEQHDLFYQLRKLLKVIDS